LSNPIDVRGAVKGFDTLTKLIVSIRDTPTVHTPSGGRHLHFMADPAIRNTAGGRGRGVGTGLDWRGAGGYTVLPTRGSGYSWDAALNLETIPFAPVPAALLPREREAENVLSSSGSDYRAGIPDRSDQSWRYFLGALNLAAKRIREATAGAQKATINGEAFSIGSLVAALAGRRDVARSVLIAAARSVPTLDPARPWHPGEPEAKAMRAFEAGLQHPRGRLPEQLGERVRRRLKMWGTRSARGLRLAAA
jgi:hypothetical protein